MDCCKAHVAACSVDVAIALPNRQIPVPTISLISQIFHIKIMDQSLMILVSENNIHIRFSYTYLLCFCCCCFFYSFWTFLGCWCTRCSLFSSPLSSFKIVVGIVTVAVAVVELFNLHLHIRKTNHFIAICCLRKILFTSLVDLFDCLSIFHPSFLL